MKNLCRLELYNDDIHRDSLSLFLKEFAVEVYGNYNHLLELDSFINHHSAVGIYMVYSGTRIIGFTSFIKNTYYGMRNHTIGNDFIFIIKRYRRSKAMHLISIQSGKIAIANKCNLEHYYADGGGSTPFIGRMKGKLVYNAYEYPLDIIESEVNRLVSKVKIKD